jgi:hypothetical protein
MSKMLLAALTLAMTLTDSACRADGSVSGSSPPKSNDLLAQQANTMKISIRVENKVLTATLTDSATTRDFVSLLPLTLAMRDLFGREKSGDLPRPISEGGAQVRTYEVGDVIYWSPSAHLAIFYRHDGQSIPSPGIIVIGKIESGVDALNVPGTVKVTIEAVN